MCEPLFIKESAPVPEGAIEIQTGIGSKIGAPDYRVLVKNDKNQDVIISLYLGMETDCFREIKFSKKSVFFGVGDYVYWFNRSTNVVSQKKLEGYFGGLYPVEDIKGSYFKDEVFVTSASTLTLMDCEGREIWEATNLGIDGVVVHRVENNTIYGAGEFDPPDGWEEFEVNLKNGKTT